VTFSLIKSALDSERPPNKRQKVAAGSSPSQSSELTMSDRDKRPHSLSAVTIGINASNRQIRKMQSYPAPSEIEDNSPPPPTPTPTTPNSNNKKRLSLKHKNSLNLTIFAPSYHEQLAGVRSAPINSNFNQQNSTTNQQIQQHRANYGKLGLYL
jgi:hypothetical protein